MKKTLLSVAAATSLLLSGFAISAHAADAMHCAGCENNKMCAQMCGMDDAAKSSGNSSSTHGGSAAAMQSKTPGAPFTWGG